jgi:protein-disulfide isomerase
MRKASPLLAAALLVLACGGEAAAPAGPTTIMRAPIGASPQRGPADAWVTIVEFADFQCPFCRDAAPTVQQVLDAYPSDVRLVFKHLPLTGLHARAMPAALAADCAGQQGQFWGMHDLLFAAQDASGLDDAHLTSYATQLGLNVATWQGCLESADAAARVNADVTLATQLGVSGTPTFAVNGTPLVGAQPFSAFQDAVGSALAAARASGIPRDRYYDVAVLGQP